MGDAGFFPDITALDTASASADAPVDQTDQTDQTDQNTEIQTLPQAAPITSSQPSLYLDSNDVIVFTVWNSNAGLTALALTLRVVTPDGEILIQEMTLPQLTSDRTPNAVMMNLQEGFLVSVMVNGAVSILSRGQTFASAKLNRGGQASPPSVFNLFADYVTEGNQPQWPNGRNISGLDGPGWQHTVMATVPGAGQDITLQVPLGARWKLISVDGQLQTSAQAGNRTPTFFFTDGGTGVLFIFTSQTAIAGNVKVDYFFGGGMPIYSAFLGIQLGPIPIDLHLAEGYEIFTQTVAIQTLDQWNRLTAVVEEWLDV